MTDRATFEALDGPSNLMGARPGPDLAAHGYVESEHVVRGTAVSYAGHEPADYATRVVVRRPVSPGGFSGTVVVEWLNVTSGSDTAPDWTYLADEVVRQGHAWAGVSAQFVGVEGGDAVVGAGLAPTGGLRSQPRYAGLSHPGDAYCYSIFARVTQALDAGPLADLVVDVRLAVGESQSAFALTTFLNVVQPAETPAAFDGFLVHSRGGAAMPLGEPGRAVDPRQYRGSAATPIRDDLDVPVLIVQTETDLLSDLDYLPARQPDSARIRLWEIAGTAHADKFQIGELEELLGCPRPVNTGQQVYVVRAALRRLDAWARGGPPPPQAARLTIDEGAFVTDDVGNTRGGVRTPAVDVPTSVLRGDTDPAAPYLCQLFGSTLPMSDETLRWLYDSRAAYLKAYEEYTDVAIEDGFILPEDRDAVLAEARPDLIPEEQS